MRTRLILVARAQSATLREAARTHEELAAIGLRQQTLVINGILPQREAAHDALAAAVFKREQQALADDAGGPAGAADRPCGAETIQSGRAGCAAPVAERRRAIVR